MRSSLPHALAAPPSSHSSSIESTGAAAGLDGFNFMLDLVFDAAPKPGTGAGGGMDDDDEGVGETAVAGLGVDVALDTRGAGLDVAMAECTSLVDICFDSDENAHPAMAPAAPVAEVTRPAWPVPFCAEVVVTGPCAGDASDWTVSG